MGHFYVTAMWIFGVKILLLGFLEAWLLDEVHLGSLYDEFF